MGNIQDSGTGNETGEKSSSSKYGLTPISPKFHSEILFEFETQNVDNLTKKLNYGFLPSIVVHLSMSFMRPKYLVNVFQTCKLVCQIGNTNLFWKDYYHSYFKENIRNSSDELNWKKTFFNRFYYLTDCSFRRKFVPIKEKSEMDEKPRSITIMSTAIPGLIESSGFLDSIRRNFRVSDQKRYFPVRRVIHEFKSVDCVINMEKTKYFYERSGISFFDAAFLVFSVYDMLSFEEVKNVFDRIKRKRVSDRRVFLLVGITDNFMGLRLARDSGRREVEYEKGVSFAREKNLLGYIECSPENNVNVLLSFGVLLEGAIRRSNKGKYTTLWKGGLDRVFADEKKRITTARVDHYQILK